MPFTIYERRAAMTNLFGEGNQHKFDIHQRCKKCLKYKRHLVRDTSNRLPSCVSEIEVLEKGQKEMREYIKWVNQELKGGLNG